MTKATPLSFSILRPEFAETKDIFLMIWVELALKIHRFIISNILAIEYIRHSINELLDLTSKSGRSTVKHWKVKAILSYGAILRLGTIFGMHT